MKRGENLSYPVNVSKSNLTVGDIFYSKHGYGSMLVDFWEITKITEKSVVFSHIDFEIVEDHGEWDRLVRPIPGHYSICTGVSPISAGSDKVKKAVSIKEASKITKRLSSYDSSDDCFNSNIDTLSLSRYMESERIKQSWTYHLLR